MNELAWSVNKETDEMELITITPSGGSQTKIESSFTEVPQHALHEVAKVMNQGMIKYGRHNWYKISVYDEIDHSLEHLSNFMRRLHHHDAMLEELSHYAARALMALDQFIRRPDFLCEEDRYAGIQAAQTKTQSNTPAVETEVLDAAPGPVASDNNPACGVSQSFGG